MSAQTGIEWCDSTLNFWSGCTKVSPACDHCYAERQTHRFGQVEWGAGKPRKQMAESTRAQAQKWNDNAFDPVKGFHACPACGWRGTGWLCGNALNGCRGEPAIARRRVFVNSWSDWLDNEAPIEWLVDLLDSIRRCPNIDFLLLTKRIGNFERRVRQEAMFHVIHTAPNRELESWLHAWAGKQPPANVWLGATVINQTEADRDVPKLLAVPARVRFLSIEPMLGPIDLSHRAAKALPIYWEGTQADGPLPHYCGHSGNYLGESARRGWAKYSGRGIDWIIAGGESGPHARPSHPDWYRSLRDQCAAAGVAFMLKQWGEWGEFVNEDHYTRGGEEKHAHAWVDRATGEHGKVWLVDDDGMWSNWTGDPRSADIGGLHEDIAVVGRHGKKAAGRQLDGRTHDGFPAVQP